MKIFGKELKLIIFDVDGVILDLYACFQDNLEWAAYAMNLPIEPIGLVLNAFSSGAHRGYPRLSENIKQLLWPSLNEHEIKIFIEFLIQADRENPYPPIPGALETVRFFRNNGVLTALCTTNNKNELFSKLMFANIDSNLFDFMTTGDTGFIKPNPRALSLITDSLGIPKENTIFVGGFRAELPINFQTAKERDARASRFFRFFLVWL